MSVLNDLLSKEPPTSRLVFELGGGRTQEFVFAAIGADAYDELVAAHPPTKEQEQERWRNHLGSLDFNEDTFPPAVISACLIEPKLTEDEVGQLFRSERWTSTELTLLFVNAVEINKGATLAGSVREAIERMKDAPADGLHVVDDTV